MVKCCVDDEKLVYKLMAWINWTELHSSDFEIVDTNVTRIFVVLLDFKIDLTLLFWIRFKNCISLIQMEYVQRWLDTLPKGKWFLIRNRWSVECKKKCNISPIFTVKIEVFDLLSLGKVKFSISCVGIAGKWSSKK